MPASRAKRSSAMKQSTLPFLSRRTSSTANVSSKTKAKPSPAVADDSIEISSSSSSESDDEIEEIESEDAEAAPVATAARGQDTAAGWKRVNRALPIKVAAPGESPELRVGDKRWNKIWNNARSKMNNLQPIHGEEDNKFHQILRVFDMSYEYGPCVGVSRLQRWERASALGLNPPVEIRDILLTRQGMEDTRLSENVLHGYQV